MTTRRESWRTYPTPGIMSNTRAVDVSIHAMSPDWIMAQCQSSAASSVGDCSKRKTYLVEDIEILLERVSTRGGGAIVRNEGGIIQTPKIGLSIILRHVERGSARR